jgi:hypothetical protein
VAQVALATQCCVPSQCLPAAQFEAQEMAAPVQVLVTVPQKSVAHVAVFVQQVPQSVPVTSAPAFEQTPVEQPHWRFVPSPFGKWGLAATEQSVAPTAPLWTSEAQVLLATQTFWTRSQCLLVSVQVAGQAMSAPVQVFLTVVLHWLPQVAVLVQQVFVLVLQTAGLVHLQSMFFLVHGS